MAFLGDLDDPTIAAIGEPARDAAVTLVAFAGIRGGMGIPPYEFLRSTEGLDARRILVRDLDQVWYLRGIRGLGDTLGSAAAAIRDDVGDGRLVLTGNSAGGFAAIAVGALVGADQVHAFSPQTAIDRAHRLRWLDGRWSSRMRAVRRLPDGTGPLDLAPLLRAHPGPEVHIHYCGSHGRDARHARHLAGVAGVTLHPYDGDGHRLVRDLRDRGVLDRIFTEAVA